MGSQRQAEVGMATFLVIRSIWGRMSWGSLASQPISQRGPFCAVCVFERVEHNPFSSSVGEAGGAAGGGPVRVRT